MKHSKFIVVGGGPAGTTAAILLAQQQQEVVLFEKQTFPRFQIGESLPPMSIPLLHKLGFTDEELRRRYPLKLGGIAQYKNATCHLLSSNGLPSSSWPDYAFQVKRDDFDLELLNLAKNSGVTVHINAKVHGVDINGKKLQVLVNDQQQDYSYETLIDGSGIGSPIARKLGERIVASKYNECRFAHISGDIDYSCLSYQFITFFLFPPNKWLWAIPLGHNKLSIGLVYGNEKISKADFTHLLENHEIIGTAIKKASIDFVRGRKITNYFSETYSDSNIYLVGDAAFFTDPVFSSGVATAMHTSEFLVNNILLSNRTANDKNYAYNKFMTRYYNNINRPVGLFYSGLEHAFLVKSMIKAWDKLHKNYFLRVLQDWGNGGFNAHYRTIWVWSFLGNFGINIWNGLNRLFVGIGK